MLLLAMGGYCSVVQPLESLVKRNRADNEDEDENENENENEDDESKTKTKTQARTGGRPMQDDTKQRKRDKTKHPQELLSPMEPSLECPQGTTGRNRVLCPLDACRGVLEPRETGNGITTFFAVSPRGASTGERRQRETSGACPLRHRAVLEIYLAHSWRNEGMTSAGPGLAAGRGRGGAVGGTDTQRTGGFQGGQNRFSTTAM